MKKVRIGNGCGFWGDNLDAPIELAKHGQLDYLTLEYLAELTMSILALQKQRHPERGYAHDFLKVLERLCPTLQSQPELKIITNAGGMNALGCAQNAVAVLARRDLPDHKIAIVEGDDVLPLLDELLSQEHSLANLETGEDLASIRDRVVSANVYLGARPIVEALKLGASIVITGRIADASLTVGPAIYELGWSMQDWDRLCAATVAGHLIECGAQVTGGLWCNWSPETDLANVGYPIAIVNEDGPIQITKPAQTGGRVNRETVIEQLLYEVGDPARYLTPDVVADFTTLSIKETDKDLVEISDVKGHPATSSYKVSIAYRNGFSSSGNLVVFGPKASQKAEHCGEIIRQRLQRAGSLPEKFQVECLGTGVAAPTLKAPTDVREVVLRVTVYDPHREVVERFTRELAPLVTSGPPGITGYATGRPAVREVFAYWPALLAKEAVQPQVRIISEGATG